MDLQLLGPVEATVDGRPIPLGATKQRALLAMLALHANESVSLDSLIGGLWEGDPPATAAKMVQLYVSQLRRLLAGNGAEIVTHGRGYELRLDPDRVDATRFERAVEQAAAGDGMDAREALAMWKGPPLANIDGEPFAADEIRRLEELRLEAAELAIEADLAAGRHREVIGELERLVAANPLSERLHGQLMLALYRSGRQAEALEAYRDARRILVEEVGIEPGPELRALHDAVLRQDSATLDPPKRAAAAPAREAPQREPRQARRTGRWLVAGAGLALIAGVAVFAASRILAPDSLPRIDENQVGLIDPHGRITDEYPVGHNPGPVVAGGGSMWIANTLDGTVARIPGKRDRTFTIPVGGSPTGLAFGAGALWVADGDSRSVAQVDPGTNAVEQRIDVGNAPRALAAGYGALWVASSADSAVRRVDLRGGAASRTIPLGTSATAIAAGAGAIWVASEEGGTVTRIEPRSGTVVTSIQVGNGPSAVAVGDGAVWSASRYDGTLSRIDPATNAVSWTVHVGGDPVAVAAGAGAVWVATNSAGTVIRVDPRQPRVLNPVAVGGSPAGVAIAGDTAWVSAGAPPSSHRGGTLRVLWAAGGGGVAVDWMTPLGGFTPGQQLESLAYDGLVRYRRVGGPAGTTLVGALAERVPQPSADGLTYTFTLWPGLRYSDGRPVQPEDFRASMERFLEVTRKKGFSPYFAGIVGAERCMQGPGPCDLSKGIETDAPARTITIHLKRPDADFLHALTQPFAFVVPSDTPRRPFGELMPPGTGPYRFAAWNDSTGGYLVRNPYFRGRGERPAGFADRVEARVDPLGTAADMASATAKEVAEVQRGGADVTHLAEGLGTQYPPEKVRALAAAAPGQIQGRPYPVLEYMFLNVRRAPFNDARVRRALNYATDRARLVAIRGPSELSVPTCQILPTAFPGYVPYCPYTSDPGAGRGWAAPDVERARRLVAESGTAGQRVIVRVQETKREYGRYFADLLADLGYRASLRVLPEEKYFKDPSGWQIGWAGYAADFLTPAGFIEFMFECGSKQPFVNASHYCDPRYDRAVKVARAAQGAEAGRRWAAIDRMLTDAAPIVPILNARNLVFVSKRVGNVQNHMEGPLLDQMWVQ